MNPAVTIVIVNFNTAEATAACVDSVLAEGMDAEVVVVDNGSRDGSVELLRSRFPDVEVVDTGENLGFAAGVNRGAAAGSGERILLLNPDTIVHAGSLDALLGFADAHPAYRVYGGRTLRPDGELDPSSCWGEPTLWSLVCFATGLTTLFHRSALFDPESLGRWQRDTVREVPVVTGCLLLISRDDWELLGGMDERFFLYGEDADFSRRARMAGMRPVIVPDAVIVHEVGGSTASSGRKMCLVMAGKATDARLRWSPGRARLALALLAGGAGLRALLGKDTWREVWRRRADWEPGYPAARAALFSAERSVGV
ncbi:glycosyltransferase family 2 protein [Protaetiibacter intestinalis]|uniref:Glycosyltransferase family 2 protein n=1 Tax=Protaetiibacter intestinalis TaxID=2419774 RepID=A0A387B976_9MICO|nr:glycosyltransferase family 2 protein [Protaetiibacter intestinalis]AYF98927.1 glycosyltransferase family 2 protein [Protaetiibacter intestinalis]